MTDRGPGLCSRYGCTRVAVTFDPVPLCVLHDPGGAVGAELSDADTAPARVGDAIRWADFALDVGVNYGTHARVGPCSICRGGEPKGVALTVAGVALAQSPPDEGPANAYLRTLVVCWPCVRRIGRDLAANNDGGGSSPP